MNAVLVDSNVLIDIVAPHQLWERWSSDAVSAAAQQGRLVINPIIYAEVSAGFDSIEQMDAALPRDVFEREPIPFEAAFVAGQAFRTYRRRGGTRTTPLSDFFIGAHAAVAGYRLLTRDARRYRGYFPRLDLIAPD